MNERDRDLVVRHHGGDPEAFADLYALHHPRLLRFCRGWAGSRHLAEDVAQEAFVRAFESAGRTRQSLFFYPWLTLVARHLLVDVHRKESRARPAAALSPGREDAAEDIVTRSAETAQIRTAMGRLSERNRRVLYLREWEELSYERIAEEMRTSVAAVGPLLTRARAAFRREYLRLNRSQSAMSVGR